MMAIDADKLKKKYYTAERIHMRKNIGAKSILYPMPVLIIGTYDADGMPNAMNAAWGGISEENEISVCVSDDHKTTENFLATGCFTVSIADAKNTVAADYVGIVSGYSEDKIAKCGWTVVKSENVNAPIFKELPMALECKVKSYDKDSCRLVGEIVDISVDEEIMTDGTFVIDLQSAETASTLAECALMLGDRIHPLILKRINYELERRIFTPYLTRTFTWKTKTRLVKI